MFSLTINGSSHEIDADPAMPLLWVLRDKLNLTGTKFGCGIGSCGACTVLVDGVATRSCTVTLESVEGGAITTIESVAETEWEVLQQAWVRHQVPQCGYCQSGMLMASIGLLSANPNPTREQIHEGITNLCRCGTYQRVEAAILDAAAQLASARHTAVRATREKQLAQKRRRRLKGRRQ
jgi:isoquinoline 1-oxidoreductase alpha subunit